MGLRSLLVVILVIFSLSCKKEALTEPELSDPIYKSLKSRLRSAEASFEDFKEKRASFTKDLQKSPPNTQERRLLRQELAQANKDYAAIVQEITFLSIKLEERKHKARKSYIKAFKTGSPWPNMAEYEEYKVNRRLRQAPRDWSTRVPSFGDRYRKHDVPDQTKEKKKEKE